MIVAGIEFPDECPEECPGREEDFYQGCLCSRCPLFSCKPFEYQGMMMCLIDPEDYRPDWARAWKEWFDNGMKGLPDLEL